MVFLLVSSSIKLIPLEIRGWKEVKSEEGGEEE
jgi:hypothetical protein